MGTFILTWNPARFHWGEYDRNVEKTASGETVEDAWSVGNLRSGIAAGDRAYLLRQGKSLRGIVASGHFTSGEIYSNRHWDDSEESDKETWYADVVWDTLVPVEHRLSIETLLEQVPFHWNNLYASGNRIPEDAATRLDELWQAANPRSEVINPEELLAGSGYSEGAAMRVEVNRYERDPRARAECLEHWGTACVVCRFDFGERYGTLGQGFIHVHHLIELSSVGDDYRVDPKNDLRPLCPNCHSMVHRRHPALTPEELRSILMRRPGH